MIWGMSKAAQAEWHQWFAWYPVTLVDDRVAWLEVVLRREDSCPLPGCTGHGLFLFKSVTP